MINCTWYPVREILPLHRKRSVNSWWHLIGALYGLGHENLFFIRVTEYFLLIFNPEEACMVCFLLQNPLNPMNYLFKSIWQNHVGQRIGKQNHRVLTSSTLIHSTISINKKKLTSTVNQIHIPLSWFVQTNLHRFHHRTGDIHRVFKIKNS